MSVVKWSPCGNYLATAATNGEIFCWDMTTKKCFAKYVNNYSCQPILLQEESQVCMYTKLNVDLVTTYFTYILEKGLC